MSKGKQTRSKIAEKAAELINTRGYDGMSMSELMNATALKKGGIYNHYANKEAIALQAFDFAYIKLLERFKEGFNETGDPAEKLLSIIEVFASYNSNPLIEGHFPLIGMSIHSHTIGSLYKNKVQAAQTKLEYYIRVIITEGVEAGTFNSTLEIMSSTRFLTSALYGGLLYAQMMKDDNYMHSVCVELENWIINKKTNRS